MAWTPPSTWFASAILTAAQLNQQLRDNMKWLGDITLRDRAARYPSAAQTLTTGSDTVLTFDTANGTQVGITYSAGTFTIATTGLYLVTASVNYVANATGYRGLYIKKNGTGIRQMRTGAVASVTTALSASSVVSCAATDTITINAQQTSGGNLDTVGTSAMWTSVEIIRLL